MALAELRYYSNALRKMTGAMVVLPEREDWTAPLPVFYLLHGLSDDYTAWSRRTSIERHVETLPLIVVMPDGGRSFYTNTHDGSAYDTAITHDLIGLVDRTFHTDARREGRVIGGLSMGGYGAMRLALSHPDLFLSATSHSGALGQSHLTGRDEHEAVEFRRIFGPDPIGGPDDLFALADGIARSQLPALRIDCGTEDFLLADNRRFHAHLDQRGIAHEYAEFPGAHEWQYWDLHVQEAIAFHARNLGLAG